ASFVGRLVQQRDEVARVAGDEDRAGLDSVSVRDSGPRGYCVVQRHSPGIELHRRLLQADALDVGHSTGGNQNEVKGFDMLGAIGSDAINCDAVAVAAHPHNVGIGLQSELTLEGGNRVREHFRIADRPDTATTSEYRDTNAHTVPR